MRVPSLFLVTSDGYIYSCIVSQNEENTKTRYRPRTNVFLPDFGKDWYGNIIERVTSGVWTYEKWASGKTEIWTKTACNYAENDQTGYPVTSLFFTPGLFIAAPLTFLSLQDANAWRIQRQYVRLSSTTTMEAVTYSYAGLGTINTCVRVIGAWK